jgi:rod shape-determining protein MreC
MAFSNKRIIYAAAAIVLVVVVFVPLPSLTLKGKGAVRAVMAPAERGTSGLWRRLSDAAAAIRGIGGAVEENRILNRKLLLYETRLNRLGDAEAENTRLREAFEFYQAQPETLIACEVISRNISGWWSTVRISKGSKAGIRPDLAVISLDGLVGKTTEVTPYTTEVLLISDPACQISARVICDAPDAVFGLVRGMGSDLKGEPLARIDFINKDTPILLNDEVVTSGLGTFPKGVHIGYINQVEMDDSGLYQYAQVIPSATAGLIDYVFVVLPSEREDSP